MGRHRWRWVLQHVVRRVAAEDDLDAEIRSHLALETQRHIDTGLSPDEARRLASREFGNVLLVKEVTRDMWGWGFVESWTQDVRYAGRMLRKRLGFTAVAVASIGLGIGANTAFFSVINAALIRPLGYSNADQLVAVHEAFPQAGIDRFPFSALDFDDFQNYQQSFESAAAYRSVSLELSVGGNPERIEGTKVSAGLFRTLGVDPILGRAFSTAEDRPGMNVAILSWGLWQERYASDPSIVGCRFNRSMQQCQRVYPPAFDNRVSCVAAC